MKSIDLNCDMGESFGPWQMGDDAAILKHVSSANVACGFHAGDPLVIARTIAAAKEQGVAVGAHPGYPDLQGFGRRILDMTPDELEASVIYQIGAVYALAKAQGVELAHVKAHGALYNRAAADRGVAEALARAVRAFSSQLIFFGLAGSVMLAAAGDIGLRTAGEAFADRTYEANGSLRSRRLPGSLLADPAAAAEQAVRIALDGEVRAYDGSNVRLRADTICLHGDTPGAGAMAAAVGGALGAAGVQIKAIPSGNP